MFQAIQTRFPGYRRAKPGAYPAMILVCLALLILVTFVQVTHVHAAANDQDHCPLCVVLHSAVPIAASAAVIILVEVTEAAPVLETRATTRHWHPQLFTRPPPFSC